MIRLYLKKLLLTFIFLVLYFLFYLVVGFVWMRIASAFEFAVHPNLQFCLIVAISLVIELLAVYFLRIDNPKQKDAFDTTATLSFRSDFVNTLKSAENLIHTAAYVTFVAVFLLYITLSNNLRVDTLTAAIVSCGLFAVLNTLLWTLIHKRWIATAEQ